MDAKLERLATRWEEHHAQVSSNPFVNSFLNPFSNPLTEQWQTLFQRNLNTLGEANAQTVKAVLEQWGAGQMQMAQLAGLVNQAWGELAAHAPTADWATAVDSYIDHLRRQLTALIENGPTPQQSQEFWQRYGQGIQQASQPWLTFWGQLPQGFAAGQPISLAPLQATNQVFTDVMEQTWRGLLGAPTLGLQRQLQEKVNHWFALTLENQAALRAYQLLIAQAWLNAFAALLQKLIAQAQVGQNLETPRQLLDLWVEVADTIFLELFHSPAYATAQGKLVNSNMALRQQQRELTEIWLRQHDLPTRSDLDEAHRNIYELRKEVKALKKALAQLQNSTDSTPAAPRKGRRGRKNSA